MLSHADYLGLRRFPALDGLRAVAAALVVFFHYGGPSADSLTGWIGVHIFFVLSGFLITTLLLREESRSNEVSLWRFYVRRAARIMPVYFVVLGIVAAVFVARGEYTSSGLAADMPYHLTFMGELLGPGHPHGQVWTLGVEQKFYLLWPFIAFGLALPFGLRIGASVVIGIIPVISWTIFEWGLPVPYLVLAIGCLLAVLLHHPRGWAVVRPMTHPAAATVLAGAFIYLHLRLPDLLTAFDGGPEVVWIYGGASALLIASTLGNRGPVARLLSTRPFTFVGDRSYSLYLIQGVAGIVVAATVPAFGTHRLLTAVAVLGVSIMMADLLYRWVELPGIAFGRWVSRPREASSSQTQHTPPHTVTSPL